MSGSSPPISNRYPPLQPPNSLETLEISRWNGQPYLFNSALLLLSVYSRGFRTVNCFLLFDLISLFLLSLYTP